MPFKKGVDYLVLFFNEKRIYENDFYSTFSNPGTSEMDFTRGTLVGN